MQSLMPKMPRSPLFILNAESTNEDGTTHAFRYICGEVAVVSSVEDGEFRVSVVALRNYRLVERDMQIVRQHFDMLDAQEDRRRGVLFHEPPRMLRKPVGVVPEVMAPEGDRAPMTNRRALHLAFVRPIVMSEA